MQRGEDAAYKLTASMMETPWNARLVREEKDYGNPLVIEKMVEEWDLDEIGSNYPKNVYNPQGKEPTDFYEELAKRQTELLQAQQEEMIRKRRQQEAAREQLLETRA